MADGARVELFLTFDEYDKAKRKDGTFKIKDEYYEFDMASYRAARTGMRDTPSNWPQYSDALGVHPDQVKEATEEARRAGVNTEYTRGGRAIFRDRQHRKQHYQWMGTFDRNGGYGDA